MGGGPGGSLDPTSIPKYEVPLLIPPVMPSAGEVQTQDGRTADYYEIAVRQFDQQILPPGFPTTTVWGYGAISAPGTVPEGGTFNYPSFTIEATADRPVRVKWINDLVDAQGNFLPHLLSVDQTLHWANPPGGDANKDTVGTDQAPYVGPVPMVTHLHGAHVGPESDGYPEAWWLPDADNIPAGYATRGSQWGQIAGATQEAGAAVFQYPNDQAATTLWYHDHSLGMTRVNVYAGPAGFYLLRGGANDLPGGRVPGPAPKAGDPAGTKYHEIPIVIQDRSFNADGSLFYPSDRAFFEGLIPDQLDIPFAPEDAEGGSSDVSPIWNPEFFGNTMVVNGDSWPYLEVEPRRYRFRLLNGSNSRFLILSSEVQDSTNTAPLDFWRIGSDGGFLPEPVEQQRILMGPAERADVMVDFSGYDPGDTILLTNLGPDEPFGGGEPDGDFDRADPATTGQVMQFRVVPSTGADTSMDPAQLSLPAADDLGPADNIRKLSLNELESETVRVTVGDDGTITEDEDGQPFGPTAALLGTLNADGTGNPMRWAADISEMPFLGDTEIWEIHNFTADAHPIHLHLVQFQVVNREDAQGHVRGPDAGETGYKDTVIAYPGEITRVKAKFDIAGLFVWHCHIVEHEDNEMMRPYVVRPRIDFPDVPEGHPFYDAVQYLAQNGIVNGYANGLFGVGDAVLRAQLAKMVVVAFGVHDAAIDSMGDAAFLDVPYTGDAYPFDFVQEAYAAGYFVGYQDGTFRPYARLTRVQLVRVVVRAAGAALAEPPAGYDAGFTDVGPADTAVVAKARSTGSSTGRPRPRSTRTALPPAVTRPRCSTKCSRCEIGPKGRERWASG